MIVVNSPAKINLLLKIKGRRQDGYHEIDTIMQELELADTLSFSHNNKNEIAISTEGIQIPINIEDNLIMKASKLFFNKCLKPIENKGVNIFLKKKIPLGSGMGGGSSNAVATLIGLNQLFDSPFTLKQLIELSTELGSDTVFFLYGGRCHCSGRGEIVTQLINDENTSVVLFIPNFSVSTAQVFKNFELPPPPTKDSKYQFNDLEPAAFKVAPELIKIKKTLQEITGNEWQMTGSGSTFFNIMPDQMQLKNNQSKLISKLNGQMIQTSFQYKGCYVSNR